MKKLQTLLRGEKVSHVLPFLWMKGEENAVIGRELDRIQACGIREVCLESRPHPDFCGPGWWENLDYVCGEAQRRGMRLWILDDDKFPTGHANGGYERQPEKKKFYLAERHMDICGPCTSGAVLVKNFLGADGRLLGILAVPKPDGETLAVSGEGILDLTDHCENGFVYFDLPEGPYRLFVLFVTQKGGGRDSYMNLIDSDSVRVLIDEVYEKHYQRYQAYFGNTIAGFFSDEPELGNVAGYPFDDTLGRRDQRLPWSGELEAVLRKRWGEEFLKSLPALWYDSGEKTAAVRSVYMDEMTGLVRKCFSGQVGRWCREHGVEYIGHVIEDDNAHARMGCSIGHYFREMEGQHMAGIDVVHHQIVPGFTEPVHQWIAGDRDGEFFHFALAKLASSAAHIQGNKKGRALCEIFGNYGWAEGNSLMKWLINHMLVRGINEFTPHAFSMRYPDPDCPPHFYAGGHNPGFACFTWLMKYMNRSAHLLGGGIHQADAAILYHAESEWSGGEVQLFQKPGRKLMERQLDYDVIPADVFGGGDAGQAAASGEESQGRSAAPDAGNAGQARVEDSWLCIGAERYPCLILPYAEYLDGRVVRFVEENAPGGLKVYVVDALPRGDTLGRLLPEGWERYVKVVSLEEIAEKTAALAERMGSRALAVEAREEAASGESVPTGAESAGTGQAGAVSTESAGTGQAGTANAESAGTGQAGTASAESAGTGQAGAVSAESAGTGQAGAVSAESAGTGQAGTANAESAGTGQAGAVSTESAGTGQVSAESASGRGKAAPAPHLRSFMMRQPDGLVVMYFNESVSRRVRGRVLVKCHCYGKVTVYDPWCNRAETFALQEGSIPLNLEPGEAVFYCLEEEGSVQFGQAEEGQSPRPEEQPQKPEEQSQEPDERTPRQAQKRFPVLAGRRLLDVDWQISKAELPEELSQETFLPVFRQAAVIRAGERLPNLNGPGYWPSFVGYYRYETRFSMGKEPGEGASGGRRYFLVLPEASDSVQVVLNGTDLGFLAGFPARVEITEALREGENSLTLDVAVTLVWRRRDGASTHLQVMATGITKIPVIEWYE